MTAFDEMLAEYGEFHSPFERLNAIHEIMQQITLSALSQTSFFQEAAFYGGTCLRIFHGLKRFSEDMDFCLMSVNPHFRLEPYFGAIQSSFSAMGQRVVLEAKAKAKQNSIRSAFLKSDTAQYHLSLERGRRISIKIEVDTTPPLDFATEPRLLLQPFSFYSRCVALPDLYAGKMSAFIYRNWKNRVKGRDWYDFEWYVKNKVPLGLRHYRARAAQFGHIAPETLTVGVFKKQLREKIISTPIEAVKADVQPFLKEQDSLGIWSHAYFLDLVEMMVIDDSI